MASGFSLSLKARAGSVKFFQLIIYSMKFQLLRKIAVIIAAALVLASSRGWANVDVSRVSARPSPDWLRNGTVYEIFPRDFSAAGNLNGVTARLDDLQNLGVDILWTMPIHPIGEKFRKGELGSPYSIKDYYAVDPNYGTVKDYQAACFRGAQTWHESHHGLSRGPHCVGQCDDAASGILQT